MVETCNVKQKRKAGLPVAAFYVHATLQLGASASPHTDPVALCIVLKSTFSLQRMKSQLPDAMQDLAATAQ